VPSPAWSLSKMSLDFLSAASNGERNIDLVFAQLREHGYECGYSKLDARDFFLPQSRSRVYVWAELGCATEDETSISRNWELMLSKLRNVCSCFRLDLHSLLQHLDGN
jgi:site-specific DNA-cytosine methylase